LEKKYELDFDLRYICKTILNKWYIVLIMVILASAFSFYKGYHKVSISYEARNSLIVGNPIDTEGTKYKISEVELYERFIETYAALARSSIIAESVANKLNNRTAPETIQNAIVVTPQQNTQFINLRLRWNNRDQVVDMLNIFTDVFINEARNIYPSCTIKIIESTKGPKQIVFSRRTYIYIAPIIGLIIGILIVLGLDLLDNSIKFEEDVKEYLEVPTIGVIPREKKIIRNITPENLKKLSPVVTEAFKTLRTNIEFLSSNSGLKSISVTSGMPEEGKTLNASVLATVIANTGKRTLLVDCDLRNPSVHRIFMENNTIGLSDYLEDKTVLSGIIHKSSVKNLSIITSGSKPENPSELVSSYSMKNLVKILRSDFDYIIFDTPPIGLVTDAQVLCQITDGTLLVVSSGKTTIKEAIKSKELIKGVGGKLVGVSLNKIKDSKLYKNYSYYNNKNSKKHNRSDKNQNGKINKEGNLAT
jgi:capsular exopolysaccharide synthesis family protein